MVYSTLYGVMRKFAWPGAKEIREYLHVLDRSQWLTRQELESIQLRKIQQLVAYAYENVPFYRKRYQQEGIFPQDIKSFQDYHALPYLTRQDVINNFDALVSSTYKGKIFQGSTSGSTGHPMRYIMEKSTGYWSYAAEARSRGWHGVRPGDKLARVLVVLGNNSKMTWNVANYIKRYRYLDPRSIDEPTMESFSQMLVKWQPSMFRVYPSALCLLAQYLKEHGITSIRPKLIESTGEKATLSQRKLFKEVFNAPTVDHYSTLEIFSIAYGCPEGGLHVNEDRYLELVKNGQNVEPGSMGEIVVTSLNQYAMPFIRYKNGDLGVYETDMCKCGRNMPVLREVSGRKSDVLVKPDGEVVHWTGVYVVMMYKHEVYQYQIYQADRHHLEVRVVCKKQINNQYLKNIQIDLQPLFGDKMNIAVVAVDHIEPSPSGKLLFIISKVKPDCNVSVPTR